MADVTTIDAQARTLRIERQLGAVVERVYEAFTNPGLLAKWWGPEGVHVPDLRMDVREGGAWRTVMRNDQGEEFIVSGVFVELDEPRRLAFTWAWEENGRRGHETLVEIDLVASDGGTLLKLKQSVFDAREQRDRHEQGWTSSLVCLEAVL